MYIAEISPGRLRGRLVAVTQFNIVIEILAAFFSNYLLITIGDSNLPYVHSTWRWMFGIMSIPSALFILLLFFVPETPRWLVKKKLVESPSDQYYKKWAPIDVEAELHSGYY